MATCCNIWAQVGPDKGPIFAQVESSFFNVSHYIPLCFTQNLKDSIGIVLKSINKNQQHLWPRVLSNVALAFDINWAAWGGVLLRQRPTHAHACEDGRSVGRSVRLLNEVISASRMVDLFINALTPSLAAIAFRDHSHMTSVVCWGEGTRKADESTARLP